jgi:hypothetical protein
MQAKTNAESKLDSTSKENTQIIRNEPKQTELNSQELWTPP